MGFASFLNRDILSTLFWTYFLHLMTLSGTYYPDNYPDNYPEGGAKNDAFLAQKVAQKRAKNDAYFLSFLTSRKCGNCNNLRRFASRHKICYATLAEATFISAVL